ncbi:hypothetical protein JCM18882A_34070 [Brevibacterium metallidurans]
MKTQMSARPYSAPEFIVVIMSEAPTLASASTIPGPMSRSRPPKVTGAEVAPSLVVDVEVDIGGLRSFRLSGRATVGLKCD